MAGHEVVMTVTPLMGIDPVALEGVSIDAADAKAVEEATRKVADRIREAKRVQTGQVVSFYARIGGRLLVGATMFNGATQAGAAAGEPRDWDAEGGTEEAKGVFERFLAAHAAGGDSPLADVLQTPGLRDALPAGEPLVDIVVDPRVFMKAYGEADDAAKQAIQKLKAVGLADIGPFAWRQSFDQGRYHNGMFLVLPGPRTGLMRILDQECDPSEVPSFVTSEAVGLTQLSLDLGKAYQTVREFAVAEIGEEAGNMFLAGEMQTQGWLGVDLPKLLSSLGSRHWMIDYPSRIAAAMAEGRGEGGATARLNQAASRGAFVWQVADEAPFLKILQRLAPMAGGELQEEQGFRGIRIPNGPAAAVGRNHLVVGLGDDSLENTVAGIRNLPAGAASLRESEAARKAGELLPQEPARMFALGDASRTGGILGNVREIVANLEADDVPENYREVLAAAKGVLPTADEMQGMFGVSAATMRATADGIAVRAVWEMPAP
jgi:hypothetical protein